MILHLCDSVVQVYEKGLDREASNLSNLRKEKKRRRGENNKREGKKRKQGKKKKRKVK